MNNYNFEDLLEDALNLIAKGEDDDAVAIALLDSASNAILEGMSFGNDEVDSDEEEAE